MLLGGVSWNIMGKGSAMAARNGGNTKELTPEERRHLYEQALRCIDREENLIHYRMSWGLHWNVGGFAVLAALMVSKLPDNLKGAAAVVLSLVGIGVCVIAFIAVLAAHEQSSYVIDSLYKRLSVEDNNWAKTEFIRPYGDSKVHKSARLISKFLFVIIGALWAGVIYALVTEGVSFVFPTSGPT